MITSLNDNVGGHFRSCTVDTAPIKFASLKWIRLVHLLNPLFWNITGKMYDPEVCERMSKNLKHKMRQTFQSTEVRDMNNWSLRHLLLTTTQWLFHILLLLISEVIPLIFTWTICCKRCWNHSLQVFRPEYLQIQSFSVCYSFEYLHMSIEDEAFPDEGRNRFRWRGHWIRGPTGWSGNIWLTWLQEQR